MNRLRLCNAHFGHRSIIPYAKSVVKLSLSSLQLRHMFQAYDKSATTTDQQQLLRFVSLSGQLSLPLFRKPTPWRTKVFIRV